MHPLERKRLIDAYLLNGNWTKVVEHAVQLPDVFDIWEKLPLDEMPDYAIQLAIDYLGDDIADSGFLSSISSSWSSQISSETLRRLAKAAASVDDYDSLCKIVSHNNYTLSPDEEVIAPAHFFWISFLRQPQPHHFATVKSLFSGQPSSVVYRGLSGTHNGYFLENGTMHLSPIDAGYGPRHVLSSLRQYADLIREKILNDDDILKKDHDGKTYLLLYKGVGGHYGKILKKVMDYGDVSENEHKKEIMIPSPPFSVWTHTLEGAKAFAAEDCRYYNMPDSGIVIAKWIPLDNIMYSALLRHAVLLAQPCLNEAEFVVGHPTAKLKVCSDELYFLMPQVHQDGTTSYSLVKNSKSPDLKKNLKNAALRIGVAAAMLGIPQKTSNVHLTPSSDSQKIKGDAQSVPSESPGLEYIKLIESSGGENLNHKLVTRGLNAGTRAIGRYGIMPLQAIETVRRDKELAQKYPDFLSYHHLEDFDKIAQRILSDPALETAIANSHWERLRAKFNGNENKMAHAWLNGVTGTLNATDDEINNHWYVKRYNRYKNLLPQKKKDFLKKSIDYSEDIEFKPLGELNLELQRHVNAINFAIKKKKIRPIPAEGRFTDNSFIVGDGDEAWLVKVEDEGRPSIKSARYGIQPLKEFAAYDLARFVFGLSDVVPIAILGQITTKDGKKIAVAIKLLSDDYKMATDYSANNKKAMLDVLEKYRKNGLLHKIAAFLYIIGDGDSHGGNVMTNGHEIKMIDHGSGFADKFFSPATDKNIFIPYILRFGRINDDMSDEEKVQAMPKIEDRNVKDALAVWLLSIDSNKLAKKLNILGIDPEPVIFRLKKIQREILHGQDPDAVINSFWVHG